MKLKDNKGIQKLKEYKETYNSLMSNPRTSAGIKLGLWFIVILIVSLMVNLGGKKDYDEPKIENKNEINFSNTSSGVKEYFSSIESYQANVSLYKGDMVNSYLFTCKDKCIINFNGNKYYYDNNVYSIVDGVNIISEDINLNRLVQFNINNISDLISNVDEDYFTVFKDGSYSTLYSVVGSNFFIDLVSDNYISVKISGNNGVNNVEFDFTNLQEIDFYDKVVIDYSNVNNIDSVEDL
jgi:hypothetical protein